jgi:hypothetical protein
LARVASIFSTTPVAAALLGAVAAAASGTALAADRPRFELQAGATFFAADAGFETQLVDAPAVGFDFDDLGIDGGGPRFFASGIWRLTDRWMLRFDTFGFDDRGARDGRLQIDVGGIDLEVGVTLEGALELDLYVLNLGYRLFERDGFEIGVGAGVHYVSLDYRAAATLAPELGGEVLAARGSDDFPAPNLYGWAGWQLTDRVRGDLKAGWLAIDSGDLDGRIYFGRAVLDYGITERFGIGVGYWVTDFDVDRDSRRRVDTYDVRLVGPQIHFRVAF